MDHPTFADKAFLAVLDQRLNGRFPNPAAVVGEEVPDIIAECFRAWWADPLTRAVHHPLELRELAELMAIQWNIAVPPDLASITDALREQQIISRSGASVASLGNAPGPGPNRLGLPKRH